MKAGRPFTIWLLFTVVSAQLSSITAIVLCAWEDAEALLMSVMKKRSMPSRRR